MGERRTTSTMKNYVSGQSSFLKFAAATGKYPLPVSEPFTIMAYLKWGALKDQALDSTTLESYLAGINAWFSDFLEKAGLLSKALLNPCQDPQVRSLMASLLKHHKLESKAKRPLTWAETKGLIDRGFDLQTVRGLHNRLFWMLCCVGMLRRFAATHLRLSYRIERINGVDTVIFLPSSDICVRINEELGMRYIYIHIVKDKNVFSNKSVQMFLPESIPALGLRPVDILIDYIMQVRPPSYADSPDAAHMPARGVLPGAFNRPESEPLIPGLLLAAPRFLFVESTARSFHSNAYTKGSKAIKDAFVRAHPNASLSALRNIGSHSCRRTMAEFLWTATGHDARVVADMGHWALAREAVNRYFDTPTVQKLCLLRDLRDPAEFYGQWD